MRHPLAKSLFFRMILQEKVDALGQVQAGWRRTKTGKKIVEKRLRFFRRRSFAGGHSLDEQEARITKLDHSVIGREFQGLFKFVSRRLKTS